MKNLKKIIKFLMLLIVLIAIGFTGVSQNTISNYQILQIRLLENQAKTDSLKVINLNTAIDTLNFKIELLNTKLIKCDTTTNLLTKKINLQVDLVESKKNEMSVLDIKLNKTKKKLNTWKLISISSAILNTIFIYKAIK